MESPGLVVQTRYQPGNIYLGNKKTGNRKGL